MSVEEAKKEIPLTKATLGLIAFGFLATFSFGYNLANMHVKDSQIDVVDEHAKEGIQAAKLFTEQEVGGLRSDVNYYVEELSEDIKDNKNVNKEQSKEIIDLTERIIRLEKQNK